MNLKNLIFLFMPHYWLMNNRYSEELDKVVNHLLDNFEIESVSNHKIKIGGKYIWIENYPYGCGNLYDYGSYYSDLYTCRPSRLTILKLKNKVDNYLKTRKTTEQKELERQVNEILNKQ